MGNKLEKLEQKIEEINIVAASKRFYEVSGIRLNFFLVVGKGQESFIQVSTINGESSLSSLLGKTSIENFDRIYNVINHLTSYSAECQMNEENECCICLDKPADIILECGHQFCSADLEVWQSRNQECPLCRAIFSLDKSFLRVEGSGSDLLEEVKICKEMIFRLIEY
jgi:hypothetical protein